MSVQLLGEIYVDVDTGDTYFYLILFNITSFIYPPVAAEGIALVRPLLLVGVSPDNGTAEVGTVVITSSPSTGEDAASD